MAYLWLVFALLSAFFAGLVAIFGKIGLENIDSTTATTIRAVIMAIFLMGVIIVQGKLSQINTIIQNHKAIFYITLSGIVGALSWLFYFLALKNGSVHQIVPIDRLSIVFAIFLAMIFLGETLNLYSIIGISLVIIGTIIIAIKG